MKTIFSYIAKCLLTYTISFALLQVQVILPIQNLKYSSGYVIADDGVSTDEDGVATKSGGVELKTETSNMLIDHLAMIAFGFFTAKALTLCKPMPMDLMIGAAGGVIYIGGELFTFNAFKDLKEKDKITYTNREDGENDTQIEMLEAQKKGYDDIAKTAKTKAMIQMAAAAAYGAAAAWAFYKSTEWGMTTKSCSACTTATPTTTALEGQKVVVGPSAELGTSMKSMCASMVTLASTGTTIPASTAQCTAAMSSCVMSQATCNTDVAICVPDTVSSIDNPEGSTDAFQKFAKEGISLPGIQSTLDDDFIEEIIKETYLEDYRERFSLSNFIEKESPFYDLNKKMKFDDTSFETQINSYARNRDMSRFFQGEISSTSIESYSEFKSTMFSLEVNSKSSSLGENLEFAFNKGVDFMIPSAHASSITQMVAGAAGVFLALNKTTSAWADTLMSTPGKRALFWTAGAGLALVASNSSKRIQESAEENSSKIQEIINKLSTQGTMTTESLSGNNISIPSQIPFPINGNSALSLGTEAAPCADTSGTTGCGSLASGIKSNSGFASLGGTLGTLAGTAGSAADGITGSSSIPSSSVDGLVKLSKENNAVQKKLAAVQRKFNATNKALGKSPLDFDKVNNAILAKLRKNTQAVLSGSGKSAADVLAAIGPVATEEKSKPKAVAAVNPEKLQMTDGATQKVSGGFKLNLENEGTNDGLQSEEVLANQNAANSMNGESQDDIVANKDVSIFKVISVRYLKSGFNKLLEEDK